MKKLITLLFLINLNLFALDINVVKESFAIGVFRENGAGEKVQHKKITDENYDGTCFSKVAVLGKMGNKNIKVKIGSSLGYFQAKAPIFNIKNILIGYELTFIHYNVTSGILQVSIDGRIYDSKLFVK